MYQYLRNVYLQTLSYRHGVVRFKTRRYQGEFLRAFAGQNVTIRYDSDNVLRLRAYELETNEKPGRFLGFVEMQDVNEINYWIEKCKLPVKTLDLNNLQFETLSLQELEELLSTVNAKAEERKNETKSVRVKYRGKRNDLVDQRKREAGKRKQQSQNRGKKSSKLIAQANSPTSATQSPLATVDSAKNVTLSFDSSITSQKDYVASTPLIVGVPEPGKVISMQEKLQEKNVESFKELLKAAETDHPKLIVPRRTGRSK